VLLLAVGFFSLQSPQFLTANNLLNILVQGAVVAAGAIGLAVVVIGGGDDVISGGIDLSIGATMSLVGTVIAARLASGTPLGAALAVGIATAVAVGVVNAAAVVLGIRPLLATLATGAIAGSADRLLSNNQQIPIQNGFFIWLRDGGLFGAPAPVLILGVVFLAAWVVVSFTRYGVRLYAVGGNPIAAKVAGIHTSRYVAATYVVAALCAAIAGVLVAARSSASIPGSGQPLLLDVILAAFISAIFSRRLVVNIVGTAVGAMFVAALSNGFTLVNIPTFWTSGVKGTLILIVVAVSAFRGQERVS
jgi:ribose transport system permease protein